MTDDRPLSGNRWERDDTAPFTPTPAASVAPVTPPTGPVGEDTQRPASAPAARPGRWDRVRALRARTAVLAAAALILAGGGGFVAGHAISTAGGTSDGQRFGVTDQRGGQTGRPDAPLRDHDGDHEDGPRGAPEDDGTTS